jgi:hypothetical protein
MNQLTTNPGKVTGENSACPEQQRLFAAEYALRADGNRMRDWRVSARLFDAALTFLRRRYQHIPTCSVCMQIEVAKAA